MYEYRSGIGQMPGKPHKLLYELYYYELARFESNYFEHVVCIIFHATSWPLDSMNSHVRIQNTLQAHEILYNLYAKSMHQQHRKKKYVVVSVEEPDRRAQIAGFYLMRLPLKPKLCRSSAHFNASSLIRSHNKKSNANVKSASAQSECLWNMFTKIIFRLLEKATGFVGCCIPCISGGRLVSYDDCRKWFCSLGRRHCDSVYCFSLFPALSFFSAFLQCGPYLLLVCLWIIVYMVHPRVGLVWSCMAAACHRFSNFWSLFNISLLTVHSVEGSGRASIFLYVHTSRKNESIEFMTKSNHENAFFKRKSLLPWWSDWRASILQLLSEYPTRRHLIQSHHFM